MVQYANRRRDSIESLKKAMQKYAERNVGNGGRGAEKRVLSLRSGLSKSKKFEEQADVLF